MNDDLKRRKEVEGFLYAIREAPRDNTTRLVFADWLDEAGESDLALQYRRSYDELYREIVALCDKYDESGAYGENRGRMDPEWLIEQATDCAAGRDDGITFSAAEDFCYAMRAQGEDWKTLWQTIELMTGYVMTDTQRESVGFSCAC